MQLLTLKDTMAMTGLSYSYLYEHKKQLGFFQSLKKGKWLVEKKVFEERIKGRDNLPQLPSIMERKCQSKGEIMSGILISRRQMDKELEDLLAQKTKRRRKNITIS